MDDIAAVQGSKLTWIASVLAFKAVSSGSCSVVGRKEAGIFCLGSDAYVVHYHQQAGRGKMSLFLKSFIPCIWLLCRLGHSLLITPGLIAHGITGGELQIS